MSPFDVPTFLLKWILWCLSLWDVDNAVNIEGHLLSVCGPLLVAETVCVLSVVLGDEGVVTSRHGSLVGLEASNWIVDLGSCQKLAIVPINSSTNPEVHIKVSSLLELSVADLKGDGHSIILVKLLVEALAAVGSELDVVGEGAGEKATQSEKRRETHYDLNKTTRSKL